jgi:hypothetical protein
MHENFLAHQITFREYIRRMQRLHDRYEQGLDNRPRKEALDIGECLLSDFHHTKFDEVEIPGQYIEVCPPDWLLVQMLTLYSSTSTAMTTLLRLDASRLFLNSHVDSASVSAASPLSVITDPITPLLYSHHLEDIVDEKSDLHSYSGS